VINLRNEPVAGDFARVLEVVPADASAREPLRARWKAYKDAGLGSPKVRHVVERSTRPPDVAAWSFDPRRKNILCSYTRPAPGVLPRSGQHTANPRVPPTHGSMETQHPPRALFSRRWRMRCIREVLRTARRCSTICGPRQRRATHATPHASRSLARAFRGDGARPAPWGRRGEGVLVKRSRTAGAADLQNRMFCMSVTITPHPGGPRSSIGATPRTSA
jgi:hypothetical protein